MRRPRRARRWSAAAPAASPPPPAVGDLFERIRAGFVLDDVDHITVDREVRWFASHPTYLDRTFKRGERYLYHIVNEIEARRMPLELALLPVVESAFNPVAYSRARASGLWQFIPATGRRYGLKQNWYYDGRRDVVAATTAALDYLEFLAEEFDGDWLLAVAAYNCGEANVARAISSNRAAGKPTDFFSLKLPRETRAYVPKLLAMRRIVADPAAMAWLSRRSRISPTSRRSTWRSDRPARRCGARASCRRKRCSRSTPRSITGSRIPMARTTCSCPSITKARLTEAVAALPPEKRVRVVYHRVRPGDTLGGIADKYGVSVAVLRATNKIRGTLIHPGQDLLIAAAPTGMGAQFAAEPDVASKRAAAQHFRQARRASRRHAVEHRAVARREHRPPRKQQRPLKRTAR